MKSDREKFPFVFLFSLLIAVGIIFFFLLGGNDEEAQKQAEASSHKKSLSSKPQRVPLPQFSPQDSKDSDVALPDWRKAGAIPGEQTVVFANADGLAEFIKNAEAAGLEVLGTIDRFNAVRVRGSLEDIRALLNDDGLVDYNYRVEIPSLPDPNFWQGSGVPFNDTALAFLGIKDTSLISGWGSGVKIAVLDTGWGGHSGVSSMNITQLDLVNSSSAGQLSAHGTAVIGLLLGNDTYVTGVAQGSEVLAIKVLDGNGSGNTFTLAEGIVAAVDSGAQVINMSLGTAADNAILKSAIEYAASRGVVMVAAVGNDGQGVVTYPAAYDGVIGVAAVDAAGDRAEFSNFGEGVDIAAPGRDLYGFWSEDGYVYFDGTSASSALVAGVAARVIQNGLGQSAAEVGTIISQQANDTGLPGNDPQYGMGIVSVERIESIGVSGINDLALGDLYPATEESNGSSFPLYVTFQNRGTSYLTSSEISLEVNGTPYYYKFGGMDVGDVKSVQIPILENQLQQGTEIIIKAEGSLGTGFEDTRPENNSGTITLKKDPGG